MDEKRKILVVDDDSALREINKEVLEKAGFLVDAAINGEECLEKARSFSPDLILLDLFMPKMSGFDVIEKLKQDPVLSKIRIIICTNVYVDREDLVKKGVERCLIKSEVTPDQIVNEVREVLEMPSN